VRVVTVSALLEATGTSSAAAVSTSVRAVLICRW
jgi:hypothetical protein